MVVVVFCGAYMVVVYGDGGVWWCMVVYGNGGVWWCMVVYGDGCMGVVYGGGVLWGLTCHPYTVL